MLGYHLVNVLGICKSNLVYLSAASRQPERSLFSRLTREGKQPIYHRNKDAILNYVDSVASQYQQSNTLHLYQKCSRDNGGLHDGYMNILILAWWVMKGGYLPLISIFLGFVRNTSICLEL